MSDKIRMLVVASDNYPPSRVDVSVLFGEELASRGHQVDWLLQSEAECKTDRVVDWGGGKIWVGATDLGNSLFSRVRKHLLGIRNDLRLFGLMRSGRYEIIEVKDKFISGIFAALAAWFSGKRFVYWLSYPFPEEYLLRARDGTGRYPFLYWIRGTAFRWLLYGVLLRAARHVFVQSEQMRRDLAGHGVPLEKMTAVPMGVRVADVAYVPETPRQLLPEGEPVVLYLGSLAKLRHLEVLIGAMEHVLREVPKARLYLLGRGDHPDEEQFLRDESVRRGVSHAVVMAGQKPRAEALRFTREADVCVSPIFPTPVFNCASPTKLVEYMAMAKASVANDHPDQRFLLEQSGGGYWVGWDEREFAAAIVKVLSSRDEARAMGERGRQYIAAHRTYGVIADEVEAVFRGIQRGRP